MLERAIKWKVEITNAIRKWCLDLIIWASPHRFSLRGMAHVPIRMVISVSRALRRDNYYWNMMIFTCSVAK